MGILQTWVIDPVAVALYNLLLQDFKTVNDKLDLILAKETKMATTLDDLTADVAQETTVDASIVTLLNNIAAQLKAAGQDQAKLDALHAAIQSNIQTISGAVTANTPAA